METYTVLLIMAGIVAMDTTSGPQILVSEPFVSCSALGFLFGDPEMGLMLGIIFQLLWLGYLPLGGVHFTDNNMAAFISTASLFTAAEFFSLNDTAIKAAIIPAMFLGVFISIIGIKMRNIQRRKNGKRTDMLLLSFERGEYPSIKLVHLAGIGTAFIKGVLMALIFIPAGAILCGMVSYLPQSFLDSMSMSSLIIWGAVSASAILFYWVKGKYNFLVLGTIGGVIWILPRIV